ncbi:CoA transferase [SAR202 cluster bacterium AD-804-J14_MRT_500m]|nr:CoA transferase [SAR202 cluster bacterium AD-804-J14_MRT_500m]
MTSGYISSKRQTLQDILVVSLEQAVAAPYCSSRLADAGARVIKIERPEGDFARDYDRVVHGESAYFVWLNRGKESIALDLKDQTDKMVMSRLISRADVFIQNLAPGAAARLGFGSAVIRQDNPQLITCDISGYGEDGPYSDMRAYDLLVQAESGLASVTGRPEGPGRVGVSVCDIGAGMYAYMAVLEALLDRQRTGIGKGIAVSLFDTISDWMTVPLLHQVYGGQAPPRLGLNHPSIAPYGAYGTSDGSVVIAVQNDREWSRFCNEVMKQPAMITDPKFQDIPSRAKNRSAVDAAINNVFKTLSRSEVINRLRTAQIAYGSLNSVADLADHPQLRLTEVQSETGPLNLVSPPGRLSDGSPQFSEIPTLDQHGSQIRREFAP